MDPPFFETEHMVIILVVFLTLVSGMCFSIIVSCWGKIQERRRRKLEYNIRKSREASMEGQLNMAGEPDGGGGGGCDGAAATGPAASVLRQRVVPLEQQQQQQQYWIGQSSASLVGGGGPAPPPPPPPLAEQQLIYGTRRRQPLGQQQAQRSDSNDTSATDAQSVARFFGASNKSTRPILSQPSSLAAGASVQPMIEQLAAEQQQQLRRQMTMDAGHRQQALTLSALHAPYKQQQQQLQLIQQQQQARNPQAIYASQRAPAMPLGLQHHPLSSSVTCCNLIDASGETPLIGDLVQRAKMQQQQLLLGQPQAGRPVGELRAATLSRQHPQLSAATLDGLAAAAAAAAAAQQQQQQPANFNSIPRSLSAHQLSKRSQMLQQQALHHNRHLDQHQHLAFKPAAHAPPPNHSLSYPHSCAQGSHQQDSAESAALLPPPPPPPSLQVRGSASCAALSLQAPPSLQLQLQGQQPPLGGPALQASQDSRRAAFRYSRLEQSQLTGDTLPDSDLLLAPTLAAGSLQFDELSTESDATFGMLIDSVGGAGAGLVQAAAAAASQQGPGSQQAKQLQLQQQQSHRAFLSHLSSCNFVRRQRGELADAGQPLACDCGALARANQVQQQQRQQELMAAAAAAAAAAQSLPRAYMASAAIGPEQQQQQQRTNLRYNPGAMLATSAANGQPNYALVLNAAGNGQQQQQQATAHGFGRFRQQSSEMTADDEDEDEEEEEEEEEEEDEDEEEEEDDDDGLLVDDDDDNEADLEVGQLVGATRGPHSNSYAARRMLVGGCPGRLGEIGLANGEAGQCGDCHDQVDGDENDEDEDDDDDEEEEEELDESSELGLQNRHQNSSSLQNNNTDNHGRDRKQRLVSRNELPLKEAPAPAKQLGEAKRKLHGSHTSLGCQSCTCGTADGSQSKLNNNNNNLGGGELDALGPFDGSESNQDQQQAAGKPKKTSLVEQQQQQPTVSLNVMEKPCDKQIAGSTTTTTLANN